ncbi:hypothetical protein R3P38DRAFT_2763136 [Favolaschia claudopus]|uniref:Uncharacterized protein n=1 Tax=Favolaschia claudopus TaxID=2862362 RepID=A0AAW0DGP3_9AGAR
MAKKRDAGKARRGRRASNSGRTQSKIPTGNVWRSGGVPLTSVYDLEREVDREKFTCDGKSPVDMNLNESKLSEMKRPREPPGYGSVEHQKIIIDPNFGRHRGSPRLALDPVKSTQIAVTMSGNEGNFETRFACKYNRNALS